ncbi:NADH-FMN oxidoreductase RutF, flavin reductase (DIM6/NTAB) family [Hymenobacter daecheongensis DSM 21074]|uniref:NADH-FMN oxidoreductase RutF, flavin reductase (DIM6/NTAB) family n=1 Tax=Hymenobacter daecheongensis DSM 21074 TaxID=1121955 RepID=A0A1M6JLY7_9BACT|nr:flavin reductase family protein [Hymenobacter daecheongensis]SHJ47654.1 NADH-FMN oxidoreductase RutF, flavin reductase (DIM6/NTAB) family [Hymenobacter daecheongensis DSM 21074]
MHPSFRTIDPAQLKPSELHPFLVGAIAPRPVAFASTISADGSVNLSPYSFFNAFGSNPPILVFSPANRVRDNSQKHTLQNVREVPEVVIHICDYAMVEQMSLASTEYEKGVNEFVKAGFTELPSQRVRPPRVAEAPAAFECVVEQIIELGQNNGAGNLIICRVVMAHFREDIVLPSGLGIDPFKLDAIARLGGDWYCRASGSSLFEVPKPNRSLGIGIDQLPAHIRNSDLLTGNNLGRLANIEQSALPTPEQVADFRQEPLVSYTMNKYRTDAPELRKQLTLLGQQFLAEGKLQEAWKTLLLAGE